MYDCLHGVHCLYAKRSHDFVCDVLCMCACARRQLTEYAVADLNERPVLPYNDTSFDAVVCALSIDYLTQPLAVLREVSRVLRPGGSAAIVFSDRLFLTKAVAVWTGAGDLDHVYTVGQYFHYCGPGCFEAPKAIDLLPGRKGGDPLYAVVARKPLNS
jgi:SAM-dependent methyltransferase